MGVEIIVRYRSIDGCNKARKFKTVEGARRYAKKMVGDTPDMGSFYAVSYDGIGKITCAGISLADLFAVAPVAA